MALPNTNAALWTRPGFQANLTRAIAFDMRVNDTQVTVALANATRRAARRGLLQGASLDVTVTVTGFGDNATAANAAADTLQAQVGTSSSATAQATGTTPVRTRWRC